jgi:hypothetical protein
MPYSKTNLGQAGAPLSRRAKRVLLSVGVGTVVVLAGLGLWSAFGPDRYGPSANGCVTVNFPSSTGGSLIHYCGSAAKAFCKTAYADDDRISLLARPQCKLAGLAPSK